jgi:hypothetical protein
MLQRWQRETFEQECSAQFKEAGFECWALWDGDDERYTVRMRRGELAHSYAVSWIAIADFRPGIRALVTMLVKGALAEVRAFNRGDDRTGQGAHL